MRRAVSTVAILAIAVMAFVINGSPSRALGSTAEPAASPGGTFSVGELEPPHLLPGQDDGASLDEQNALWAPLTKVDAAGHLTYVQAQSVTPSHRDKVWTIKIKPGWTFSNGEPVTAESYIDAWNATAYGPNAWANSGSLSDVVGYAALNPKSGKPKTSELSGLKAINATTVRVQLSQPDSQFPLELTTSAFLPMPKAAFSNLAAYDQAPIGDGPYEMDGSWVKNQYIDVKRYPGYKGPAPHADEIQFKIYTSTDAMYTALQAGQVDIANIGQTDYAQAKHEFGSGFIAYPAPAIDYLGFPLYNSYFKNQKVREAISLAINRQAINKALYGGILTPATSILPPAELGAPAHVCAYCRYDPKLARKLLAQAGGWKGPLVIWYPSGAGYDQTFEAIANQLQQNLHISKITFNTAPFTPFLQSLTDKKVTNGIYRGHWGAYYPSMQNTLEATFEATGANHNASWYSSPAVTRLISKGNAAPTLAGSEADYAKAERTIMKTMPVVPLFYAKYVYAHTKAVSNVVIDVNQIELGGVTVNQ